MKSEDLTPGGSSIVRDVAPFESYGARWERLNRFNSGDRNDFSGERLLFGFDGGDFLDLAAG